MRSIKRLILLCVLAVSTASGGAAADERADRAIKYCNEMQQQIDAIVTYTRTICVPGQGNAGMSFIFISDQPVFSVEASKKPWLMVVVGVFGNIFNSNSMTTDELIVSDASMMRVRKAFRIPSTTAREIQRKVKADQMGLEEMYSRISAAMRPYEIPQRR